jgi:hypothetical protein
VVANTVEKCLLDHRGQPSFDLELYILNRRGEHAAVSLYPARYAICTDKGPETLATEALYEGHS